MCDCVCLHDHFSKHARSHLPLQIAVLCFALRICDVHLHTYGRAFVVAREVDHEDLFVVCACVCCRITFSNMRARSMRLGLCCCLLQCAFMLCTYQIRGQWRSRPLWLAVYICYACVRACMSASHFKTCALTTHAPCCYVVHCIVTLCCTCPCPRGGGSCRM